MASSDDVRIRLLGPVDVVSDVAGPGGPKQRLLLAVLALRANEVVATDVLVDILWSGRLPDDPQRSLQVHVSKLRRVVAAVGITIEHRAGGYVLQADAGSIDVDRFERLVADAAEIVVSDPERTRHVLNEALALWRGRPLEGLTDHPALRGELARLEELRSRAIEARVDAELALGRHDHVTAELYRLTADNPLREGLWERLMLALYRTGRPADALECYEHARRHLADELGADPSPSLRELHAAILRQDPTLDVPGSRRYTEDGPATSEHLVPDRRTVAVLPFEVIGDAEEMAFLAVGLHADLVAELSGAPQLEVISRTSVLSYPSTETPVPRIGRELNAGTIIEGTVQSVGSRFRVTVQMVDARRDTHRWTASYDDELTTGNVFAVQAQLARDIAAALSAELTGPPEVAAERSRTASLEAYRLVAAGRHHFDTKTEDGFRRAIECFQAATELDPDYPDAWIGLSQALASMDAYGHGDRHDLLPRAERAVHRALALAPSSAEARTSLGILHVAYQEGPAALDEFRRAIAMRPSYADAHNWHSWVSLIVGDAEGGLEHARRTVDLDPRSAEAYGHLALAEAAKGRPEDGAAAARQARRLSPYTTADLYEALCCYEAGRLEDVERLLEPLAAAPRDELAVPWAGHGPDALLALTSTALGRPAEAREISGAIETGRFPFDAGVVQLALGDLASAERAFERADRLTAWPCLLVHHHLRDLWDTAPDLHAHLTRVARRSWAVEPRRMAGGKRDESGT